MVEPAPRLEELGRAVASTQDELLRDQRNVARVRARLLSRERRSSGRWRVLLAAAAVVAAAAAASIWLLRPEAPLFTVDGRPASAGRPIDAGRSERALRFADGSTVKIRAGARAEVETADRSGARLRLEAGAAAVDIVPRDGASWVIAAGPFEVAVIGTRFDVGWRPGERRFDLDLHRGTVVVRGPFIEERTFVGPARVRVWAEDGRIETGPPFAARSARSEARPAEPVAAEPASPAAPPSAVKAGRADPRAAPIEPAPAPAPPIDEPPAPPDWQALAREGRYREALAAAEAIGFERAIGGASAPDLVDLGDVARLAGSASRAEQAYRAARERFPGTPAAGAAAFNLGRLSFDQRGAPDVAARWFETYLREQPAGRLRREASGRLIEALERAGHRDRARRAAREYLQRYPTGPHAPLAESVLAGVPAGEP